MKHLFFTGIAVLFFLVSLQGYGQKETNREALLEFAAMKSAEFQKKHAEALEYARQNDIPIIIETDDTYLELMYFDDNGIPQYYGTDNVNAAATISTNQVNTGGSSGYNLDGSGMTIHEWDGGGVLTSHQEYGGRVTQIDNPSSTHYHSTHVAGTLMAAGVVGNAKGMAPAANLNAYDWNSDESEVATAGANGALVSNHSYGFIRGWYNGTTWYGDPSVSVLEDYRFGFYDGNAQQWDQIAYNAPYFLICKSAGNDRNDSGDGSYPPDGNQGTGYDCIGTRGIAKNLLTVGAVADISGGYSDPSDVVMSSFSSWGPADDGRIKPDISANGVSLYSTYNTNNSSYASLSGTSMATPSAAGSLILLQEHYENLTQPGNYMLASTLKAVAIHTADEAGPDPGPDYMFGWGLMNTQAAADVISDDILLNTIEEITLINGETYTRDVIAAGGEPLQVTVVWTDVPGTPPAASLDPSDAMIVNELDLRITQASNTYYPWKLNKDVPSAAATRNSENNVDNVEMVTIDSPTGGAQYTIVVDHDGSLTGGSQVFSLIVTGISVVQGDPPYFTSDPIVKPAATEDLSYSANIASDASDPDGDPLSFQKISGPAWLTVSSNGDLSGTPSNSDVGVNSWTVQVSDGNGGTDQATLEITVINVNDAPVFTSNPIVEGNAYIDAPYSGSIADNASDDDGDNLSFAKLSGPAWLVVASDGSLSGTPLSSDAGANTWTVLVEDGNGGSDQATLEIEVIDPSIITYCESHGNAASEWINTVTIGNESYASGSSGASGYQDLSDIFTFHLETSNTYEITLVPGFSSRNKSEYWKIWIDFDLDGNFDVGEEVFSADKKRSTVTGTITIPSTSPVETTMRVSMKRDGTPSSCEIFSLGEVEDYSVTISTPGPQPPVADFNSDVTTVVVNGTVNFSDQSTNDPTTWSWTFDGGTPGISSAQNPSVVYNSTGLYDVTLVVTNSVGSDTEIKTSYINVINMPLPPQADFTANPQQITAGESVQFIDNSINDPTSWSWDFGNGGSSTVQNPTATYNTAGVYSVSLTATNAAGSDTETKVGFITVDDPPLEYCSSAGQSTSLEWIQSVSINGTTTNSGDNLGYGDLTGTTYDLTSGSTASFVLTPGFQDKSQREFWRVWIDYNADYFFDASEEVIAVNNTKSAASSTISIPSGLNGSTRMRISMKQGSAPLACGDFSLGEVEDYTVNFIAGNMENESKFEAVAHKLMILPNPTKGQFRLFVPDESLVNASVTVYDINGRMVFRDMMEHSNAILDLGNLNPGIYQVIVRNDKTVYQAKLLKQ